VIIVGAGLSGLQCGSALVNEYGVDKSKILVLEAQDYVGGRVKQMNEFIKGAKIEVGAEFLHGESSFGIMCWLPHKESTFCCTYIWSHGFPLSM
jgi:protoporphyrinogen oxidase